MSAFKMIMDVEENIYNSILKGITRRRFGLKYEALDATDDEYSPG
jgi:hypothetical protein